LFRFHPERLAILFADHLDGVPPAGGCQYGDCGADNVNGFIRHLFFFLKGRAEKFNTENPAVFGRIIVCRF
jgi:hypothetical protein